MFKTLKEILTEFLVWTYNLLDHNHMRWGCQYERANFWGTNTSKAEENKLALYVHCCAHNLNLVLSDGCSHCAQTINLFGNIQKLYKYVTLSQPRLNEFKKAQKLKELNMSPKKFSTQSKPNSLVLQIQSHESCKRDVSRLFYSFILQILRRLKKSLSLSSG